MVKRQYGQLIREFFKIYPDYPLCKTLAQNLMDGVCSYDHAEQLIYGRASGAAQNREAIEEKLSSRKIEIGGEWHLLKEVSLDVLCRLPDESFRQAAEFYLKNPYAHGRVARPVWYRPVITRNRFLRLLWVEARHRGMEELAADLHALFFLV